MRAQKLPSQATNVTRRSDYLQLAKINDQRGRAFIPSVYARAVGKCLVTYKRSLKKPMLASDS